VVSVFVMMSRHEHHRVGAAAGHGRTKWNLKAMRLLLVITLMIMVVLMIVTSSFAEDDDNDNYQYDNDANTVVDSSPPLKYLWVNAEDQMGFGNKLAWYLHWVCLPPMMIHLRVLIVSVSIYLVIDT
jgi:hypothetical protein